MFTHTLSGAPSFSAAVTKEQLALLLSDDHASERERDERQRRRVQRLGFLSPGNERRRRRATRKKTRDDAWTCD